MLEHLLHQYLPILIHIIEIIGIFIVTTGAFRAFADILKISPNQKVRLIFVLIWVQQW